MTRLSGKRFELVTGSSGSSSDYRASIELLPENSNLPTLFAPEHGVHGKLQGGVKVHNHEAFSLASLQFVFG